jgi:hypothetical protein
VPLDKGGEQPDAEGLSQANDESYLFFIEGYSVKPKLSCLHRFICTFNFAFNVNAEIFFKQSRRNFVSYFLKGVKGKQRDS